MANGKKFIILKQAIYHDENYLAAARISDDEKEVFEDFHFFHEFEKDGMTQVETVTDPKLVELLINHLGVEK